MSVVCGMAEERWEWWGEGGHKRGEVGVVRCKCWWRVGVHCAVERVDRRRSRSIDVVEGSGQRV